jgi:serine/threonine-protein kinase
VPVVQAAADAPAGYAAIVDRLLAKTPAQRYASADDVRLDLRRFREGRPLEAQATTVAAATTAAAAGGVGAAYVAATTAMPPSAAAPPTAAQPPAYTYGYDREPPTNRGWLVAGIILLLAALAIGGWLLYRALSGTASAKVAVPPVVGRPIDEAKKLVSDAGLVAVENAQPKEGIGAGLVYAQQPESGDVEEGSSVTLTFNPAAVQVQLPNLVGQQVAQAEQTLASLGLTAQRQPREDANQPEGVVLDQDPKPGPIDKGRAVVLVVSAGRGKVAVPNVTNLDQVTAAAQLAAAGLNPRTVQEPSDGVPAGSVIRTIPAAGQTVDKGTEVSMVVSTGAEPVAVPSVEGKTESQARDELQAAGFLQRVNYQDVPSGSAQVGKVISQSPAPGTELRKGETVSLIVGRAVTPPPTTTTTTLPPTSTT